MKLFAISLLFFLALSVHALELSTPPADFSWKEIPKINAAFLIPDEWHFKFLDQGEKVAFFISREDIDKEGRFITGITFNLFLQAKPGTAVE